MKRIFSISAILMVLFAVVSCGDNDAPKRPDLPETVDGSKTYGYELLVSSGAATLMPKEIMLSDFKAVEAYAKSIKDVNVRSSSKIMITGVSKGEHKLKDLQLRVKGTNIKKDFGTVTKDGEYNFLSDIEFIQKLMRKLIGSKEITLELTTESEKTIQKDVKVMLQIDAQFVLK